ncbi:MAG: hypothetical protein A2359_00225 [Candidatus Moranbacteria bacterium RIFOXYB1_FULL_43_19]|nr:MAG: hypothetical protein A2359_00225 [Candidatus Moranbacteria bacterium RIFOXYB1_FULL_43_19]OGI34102.1 MAG: hypothetical protein A2420_00935 [Candidatus Moranbacteria bacterium RIFOXYC1_FULL_44_13]OGI37812.1 MAG: hypothetical protein A2612_04175 [Candidatus Moranbacteria bacterium RIFOXYD1_FULL_44_12]
MFFQVVPPGFGFSKKMAKSVSVSQLMTKEVISVRRETPFLEAVDLMLKNNFNGLPVVAKDNKLVGMLSEYDLTLKGSSIHLPTFLKLLQKFDIYSKDKKFLETDVKKILAMKVKDVMNPSPFSMSENSTLTQAVKIFSEYGDLNPIPIVDKKKRLVGILARYDIIKLFGSSSAVHKNQKNKRLMDKNVNRFLSDFEKNFLFVSRFRVSHWFLISVIFILIGFAIAFLLIIKINLT